MEWFPIESAPKDGTRIQLLTRYKGVGRFYWEPTARWSEYNLSFEFESSCGNYWESDCDVVAVGWMPQPIIPNSN